MNGQPDIRVLHQGPDRVGESPLWIARTGEIAWVDIGNRAIRRMRLPGGAARSTFFDIPPAALALDTDGDIVVAAGGGWYRLADDGELERIALPDDEQGGWRMNDGASDRDGRFWTGRIADPRDSGVEGCLYRLDNGRPRRMLGGLRTQNGLAVSPDGRTLYLADGHPDVNAIWAFDLDRDTGRLSNRRVFHRPSVGRVDGAAMDAEGCYWFAGIDAGRIVRLDPNGREMMAVKLPVSRPTKLAFAGPDLRTIVVTTMSILPPGAAAEPLAGALLAFESDVAGAPATPVSVSRRRENSAA